MGALERVVERLVASGVPLRRGELLAEARRVAAEEAPLEADRVAAEAVDALAGLGPLEALLADPAVTDVLVNAPDEVWRERSGRLERTAVRFPDAAAVVAAVERAIAPLGLRLDRASPAVAARLPDGSRLHAVIPPAAVDGPVVAVRRFTPAVPDLAAMVAAGSLRPEGAELLAAAVRKRRSLLVSGGTGSGKTTLLNVLSAEIPAGERVVTIEDAAELHLRGHVVRLEARPPNAEGAGEITLRTLVRHALRLRPDRIVVGEVRGPEALDLIQAMSTGHPGSMGTVHANGPAEALWRLETLALSGETRPAADAVRRQLEAAVDLVVHLARRGERRLVEVVAEVTPEGPVEVYRC
ncbi:MAG: CpaF family protein [Acidimicrobiia bacterium]|nr:CpaF family protein [Acidimicrobiia bacterium]